MVSLVYHPVYDPYGSVLRSVRFMLHIDEALFPDQLRIFDFLLLFPEFVSSFRLSTSLRSQFKRTKYRRRFAYEDRPAPNRVFGEMSAASEAAIQTLRSKEILEDADHREGTIRLNREAVPERLSALAAERNRDEMELLSFLSDLNDAFPFAGPNGLKDRSGLLEFRYDVL